MATGQEIEDLALSLRNAVAAGVPGAAERSEDVHRWYASLAPSIEPFDENLKRLDEVAASLRGWTFPGIQAKARKLETWADEVAERTKALRGACGQRVDESSRVARGLRNLEGDALVAYLAEQTNLELSTLQDIAMHCEEDDEATARQNAERIHKALDDFSRVLTGLTDDIAELEEQQKEDRATLDELVGFRQKIQSFTDYDLKQLFVDIAAAKKADESAEWISTTIELADSTLALVEAAIPPDPHAGIVIEKVFAGIRTGIIECGLAVKAVTQVVTYARTSDEEALEYLDELGPFAAFEVAATVLKDALKGLVAPLDLVVPKFSVVEQPLLDVLGALVDLPVKVAETRWAQRRESKDSAQAFLEAVQQEVEDAFTPDAVVEACMGTISGIVGGDATSGLRDLLRPFLLGLAAEMLAALPLPAPGGFSGKDMKQVLETLKEAATKAGTMSGAYRNALRDLDIVVGHFDGEAAVEHNNKMWKEAAPAADTGLTSSCELHLLYVPAGAVPRMFGTGSAVVILEPHRHEKSQVTLLRYYGPRELAVHVQWRDGAGYVDLSDVPGSDQASVAAELKSTLLEPEMMVGA